MRIWKFTLSVTDTQAVRMPLGARVLTVQDQAGRPCIWALVDEGAAPTAYHFRVYGTGHAVDFSDGCTNHVGTIQQRGGGLVWHVFTDALVAK